MKEMKVMKAMKAMKVMKAMKAMKVQFSSMTYEQTQIQFNNIWNDCRFYS